MKLRRNSEVSVAVWVGDVCVSDGMLLYTNLEDGVAFAYLQPPEGDPRPPVRVRMYENGPASTQAEVVDSTLDEATHDTGDRPDTGGEDPPLDEEGTDH